MASLLAYLNPTPSFPAYTGLYNVGTVDVEILASELPSPAPCPDPLIPTVSFRLFYPTETSKSSTKPVHWIPEPQYDYISAYARFLGASSKLSNFIAHFPKLLTYVTIPAVQDAALLQASTASKRWPVLIFSHGLGGSRNAYSHLLGQLSSYGIVVIAPEHRDGSAPISFVKSHKGSKPVPIDYRTIPHNATREVEEARDEQLRIRMWELGLIYEALLKIDHGESLSNSAGKESGPGIEDQCDLHMFTSSLDIHTPGCISWSGHSFGAATIVQFVKSVFYHVPKQRDVDYRPLYVPADNSPIVCQITPSTTISLLDLWTLPLRSTFTKSLWEKPLPCYAIGGPEGNAILAILSEAFFKWRGNLVQTKKAVSADPSGDRRALSAARPPHIFYPVKTAHLSQSDFGVLFPWTTKAVFKAEEPERTLKLNVLAILDLMRQNGSEVAAPCDGDKAVVQQLAQGLGNSKAQDESSATRQAESADDIGILATDGHIRGWVAIELEEEVVRGEGENEETRVDGPPSEAVMQTGVMR